MPNISKAALALLLLCSLVRAEGINSGISIGGAEGINNASSGGTPVAPDPTVSSVSPTSGVSTGGTSVAVGGTNYGTGGASVTGIKFGASAASFSCSTSILCTATSPAHAVGVVDVTVTTAAGTSATSAADQFTYTFAPSCTQSSTYLAALTGLSATEQSAYDTAICGLQTDGNFAGLDGLYIHANANAANARVNAKSPGTLNITTHGTCTFTVDQGFTGDVASCYQDAGFIPSTNGGNYALNSATWGVCILNNRTTAQAAYAAYGGQGTATGFSYFEALFTGSLATGSINAAAGGLSAATTSAQGAWFYTRTSSTVTVLYKNGASFSAPGSIASISLPSVTMPEMAYNNVGSVIDFTGDQHGYWFFGSGVTSTQATQIYNRLHTMMAALGNSAC